VVYACPMHPDVVRDEPGHCPKCGMKLLPAELVSQAGGGQGEHDDHAGGHEASPQSARPIPARSRQDVASPTSFGLRVLRASTADCDDGKMMHRSGFCSRDQACLPPRHVSAENSERR
jgi:hypothetical protein